MVTTPQAAASDVAVRSGLVARQTGQRVVGVVENMAAMTLPDGTTLELFGSGGGAAVADALSERREPVPAAGVDPAQPDAARGRRMPASRSSSPIPTTRPPLAIERAGRDARRPSRAASPAARCRSRPR